MLRRVFLLVLIAFICLGPAAGSSLADDLYKGLRQELADSRTAVLQAVSKVGTGGDPTAEVARLKSVAEAIRASHLLMQERFKINRQKSTTLGGKASERLESMAGRYQAALDQYLAAIDALPADGTVTPQSLENVKALLETLSPRATRPLLGSLPYKHLGYPAHEPFSGPAVVPAYGGGNRNVVDADTAPSVEAPISKEIAAQAEALSWNPVLIYEWVKNNVETEWYWGVMKGAEETLRQKSGNDADQAALLTSLLRASGFPTRYVRGTIEFFPGIETVKNLTGLDDPRQIAAFFQKAGIPFKPVIAGGGIANFRIEHFWVETLVPYSNYRGAVVDDMGKSWLAIDTSIKSQGYTRTAGANLPDGLLTNLRDDYLAAPQDLTPLQYIKAKAEASPELAASGKKYRDLLSSKALPPDVLKIIPSSLQFRQIEITGEYTSLPDDLRHKVTFSASASGSNLFSITLDTARLSNRKVIMSYEPETVEDQQTIDSFGGLDNTPAYLVRLRPVLMLDGERMVVGQDGLAKGSDYVLDLDLVTPNGSERTSSGQLAGNMVAFAVVAQNALSAGALGKDDDAATILFKEAIGYVGRWNHDEDELAALLKQAITRPAVSAVAVGGQVEVSSLMGIPQDMTWKGVFIDAGYRRIESVGSNGGERDFMQLSALQGSVLENRIFEDDFQVESVSTAKILQLAAVGARPLLTLDRGNIDLTLPTLPFDDAVKADIANAVNENLIVRIPLSEVSHRDWTGIAYLKENQETGESGWMLSGMVAGGMTAWRTDLWPAAYLGVLANTYSEPAVWDAASAQFLEKLTASEFQQAEVGQPLPLPLQVRVKDSMGRPVKGAAVTFAIRAGGGSFANEAQTLTATTNSKGIASAPMVLGRFTKDNPTSYWQTGDEHPQQVGENIIDASLPSGKGLAVPFSVYGFPGKPAKMGSTYGDALWGTVLAFGSFVAVNVEDAYGNQVSNLPVEFRVADPVPDPGASVCATQAVVSQKTYLLKSGLACLANAPVWGECGDTSQQSLTVTTGTFGAPAQVIMGGMPGALYRITATCKSQTNPSACLDPSTSKPFSVTFNRYTKSFGNCGAGSNDPVRQLFLDTVWATDEFGRNINAGKVGTTVPLRAKLFFLREGETQANASLDCGGGAFTCLKVSGSGGFAVDTINTGANSLNSASVTFDGQQGTRLADTPEIKGVYSADYVLKPGLNRVTIAGTGTIGVQSTIMACPATCTTEQNKAFTSNAATVVQLYGVGVQVQDLPLRQIDKSGELQQDLVVSYSIDPPEYHAGTAFVVVYRQDEPVAYIPAETYGHGSATLARGYKFDMQSSYAVEVVLNQGTSSEIRSARIPVNLLGVEFHVERNHQLAKFDGNVAAGSDWTRIDSYKIFNFILKRPTKVKVLLLDTDHNEKAVLVPESAQPAGSYNFAVDFGILENAGFSSVTSPRFFVKVLYTPSGGNPPYWRLYPGRMVERGSGKMLGQVMVHDVLLQDGSLNLSRLDAAFKGRGPQFSFTRSYNNGDSPVGPKPLGEGWTHSLDLKLRPLSAQASGPGPIPDWLKNLRGLFFDDSKIPPPQGWTTVQINEGTFKKSGGTWYAERGRHGRLEETAGGFLYTAKDGTRYRYDYPGAGPTPVRSIEDRNGNTMAFVYDPAGQLSSVTDAVGRKCVFTYGNLPDVYADDSSRLLSVACPDGIEIAFSYNAQGYLQSARRGARVESYLYAAEAGIANGRYNLVKATDSNNNSYGYEYYGRNEISPNLANFVRFFRSEDVVKTVRYPDLTFATFLYDLQSGNKRTVTDLRRNDTVYTLNYYGNPTQIDEPLGKKTRMTWSIDEGKNDNVMTSKTDALNNTVLYDYDPQGNVRKETDPYGNSVATTWNQTFSLPESRTDRNGVTSKWWYDNQGNLVQETDGDGKVTNHDYYSTGERRSTTDPRGHKTAYTYDQWGNAESVTGPEGGVTRFLYDIRGRRIASTDPNGHKTSYAYDGLDYPTSVTFPSFSSYPLPTGSTGIKATVYDAAGNLLSETDRLGLTLTYTYTPRNQVKNITRSAGGVKSFGYDENGNLLSETDWKGTASTHSYDPLNRRTTTVNRLGAVTLMGYDLNGNVTALTDAEGRVTSYAYDKLNRLTDTWQPALEGQQPGHLVNTYYNEADPKTNLKSESDQEGNTTAYEYNGRYLRNKRTDAAGGVRLWAYDDSGNLVAETDEEQRTVTFSYDKQNRRTQMVQPGRIVTSFGYDPAGNRTHVTDPRGSDTETRYDQWNRPWQVIDADHFVTTAELDGEGNKVRSIDGNGRERAWNRDPRGLVLSAIDAETKITGYSYDANGNTVTATDARGVRTTFAYDAEDRKTITTEAVGEPEERTSGVLLYDKVGNPLQTKDGNGNLTVTAYNPLNLPATVKDAHGKVTASEYYRTGKVKSHTDRRQAVTAYRYDALNRVVEITDPLLKSITTVYDKVGNVRQVTDKRAVVTESLYDDLNRLIEKRRDGVKLLANEYDGAGNVTATVDANGNRTGNSYTKRNLLDTVTFADGASRKRSYDGVGNLIQETDEEGTVTSYGYDKENRQTSVERAQEKTDKLYDEVGSLVAVIKPEGNPRTMQYDPLRRLKSVTEGGLATSYDYDRNGNLLNQYDPRNNRVEYRYDELNRKTKHIQHKGAGELTVSYEYDEEGNLTKETDAKAQTFTHLYDLLNRKTDSSYPAPATPYLSITGIHTEYDANNNVTGVTETKKAASGGTVTDTTVNLYDNFDRLVSSTQRGVTISYGYDSNGNRTRVGAPGGTTAYGYDVRNRVKTATVGNAVTAFDYYPDGKKKSVSYPNGAGIGYSYFPTGRVQSVTNTAGGATISSYLYSYDRNGNRLTQAEVQNGTTANTTYSYDSLDRMTSFSVTGETGTSTTEYSFDGFNRATEKVTEADGTSTTKSYSYDETDWLTTVDYGTKTISYSYDDNGNTTRKSDSSDPGNDVVFDYDSANRMVRAMQGSTVLGLYDYDAQGMRIRHRNSDRGDVDYFYDGRSVIEERLTGGMLAHYNYADRLLSLTTGSDTQYYHFDALGSTVNLTDSAGSAKVSYYLSPWGMILNQIGDSVNRHVFTGKEEDKNTGLVYFGQRYYDAETARFITEDSYLGKTDTPPSLHRYLYAYSNPLVYIDLLGYESLEWRAVPEKPFFDKWIFDREHAKDIYRGMVNGSPVGDYRPESARTDAAMDLIRTGLEARVVGEVVGTVAGKLKQPAKNLLGKINDKLPEVVKSVAKITTEAKDGLKELGQELVDKTKAAFRNSPLANEKGQIVLRHGKEKTEEVSSKTLNEWLNDKPELLEQASEMHKNEPQWQGINPESTPVFYRTPAEVEEIRALSGERGGHHPHGLALGGPEGQTLTPTGETRTVKNANHTDATNLQRKIIKEVKRKLSEEGSQ